MCPSSVSHPSRLLYLATVLVFMGVPLLIGCDIVGDSIPNLGNDGPVTGTITNASGQRVEGATVTLGSYSATTDIDGRYTIPDVPAFENYALTITAPGYTTYTEADVEVQGGRQLDRTIHGPNQVHGQVVNSQDGQPVAGASVNFYRGTPVELQATTGADGFFNINDAPDGTFTLCIFASSFIDFCRDNVQITGGTFTLDPIAVTEAPPPGALRVVVTWGDQPSDLDAHLTGPDGAGGRFHVYYNNTNAGGATLDHDDTSGNGPETVTIASPHDGMYRFSVFNFSDQQATGAQGIGASPTRVEVYDSSALLKAYTAPSGGSGNTWRVFELTVSGGGRTFNDNGGASLGYVTASGSGDTGVFLTGGSDLLAAKAGH